MEFSDKLKNLRAEKGISQKQLADIIFVSRSAVAKWENGLGLPSEESFRALVHYFGVSKEFFETEEPEAVILQKNRKLRKYSISIQAVVMVAILLLLVYLVYHPVPFYVSANCNMIAVSPIKPGANSFRITNGSTVNGFVDRLNSENFRKSLRHSNEAPDDLIAVFQICDNNGRGNDIWLCSRSYDDYTVYIWTGFEELIACDAKDLSDYMINLLEINNSENSSLPSK